jgi:DNA repair ATPase RecN
MEAELRNRVQKFRTSYHLIQEQIGYEAAQVVRLKGKISQLEEDKKQLVKAVGIIDRVITIISANGIGKIESIVSGGLQLIWPNLSFVIEKKEGARGNSYRLLLRRGKIVGPLMDTFGGGSINVVAFLLRVIMIKRFKLAKFLAIDEGFNGVSAHYLPRVSAMISKLCHDHGFNVLAVTHQPILASAADIVYEGIPGEGEVLPVLKQLGPLEVALLKE